jgi:hypothetical protein
MLRHMTTTSTLPPCPACGAVEAIRIEYGYPTHEMAEAEERGEIRLGGCLIGPESPDFECRRCGVALPWAAPS